MASLCPTSAQQTTQTTAGLSPWSQPYVSSMLGAAQQQVFNMDPTTGQATGIVPYQAYGSPVAGSPYLAGMGPGEQAAAQASVAGPTGLQQQAYGSAAGMQTPGQFNAATDIGQTAGYGLLNTAGQAQGLQSLGMQAVQQGQQYAQDITNPYRTAQFMSPYMQNVVDVQQQEAKRQSDILGTQEAGQAVKAGAFGGSRYGLQEAERQRNLAMQLGQIQATGTQAAFQNAQAQQQAAQQQAMTGLQTGIQGYGQGIQGQTGAYGQAAQTAAGLGTLGGQQLGAQQSITNLQNTLGQQQQANQQAIINQAMQNLQLQRMYPQQQLQYLSGLLSGLPVSSTGQVSTIPGPNMLSQLAGLGTTAVGAAGLYKGITGQGIGSILTGATGGLPQDFEKKQASPPKKNKAPMGLQALALSKI